MTTTPNEAVLPLRCDCGALRGVLADTRHARRAVCYCRDCRAFARFLGREAKTLDAHGGTEILAVRPRDVRFDGGAERLRCMSLGPKGLLRWYAGCCRTPVGNTPPDPKTAYLGLIRDLVAAPAADVDAAFGTARTPVNAGSATGGKVDAAGPLAMLGAVAAIARNVGGARLSGRWRDTPFFDAGTGGGPPVPVAARQVLTLAERRALDDRD